MDSDDLLGIALLISLTIALYSFLWRMSEPRVVKVHPASVHVIENGEGFWLPVPMEEI